MNGNFLILRKINDNAFFATPTTGITISYFHLTDKNRLFLKVAY